MIPLSRMLCCQLNTTYAYFLGIEMVSVSVYYWMNQTKRHTPFTVYQIIYAIMNAWNIFK